MPNARPRPPCSPRNSRRSSCWKPCSSNRRKAMKTIADTSSWKDTCGGSPSRRNISISPSIRPRSGDAWTTWPPALTGGTHRVRLRVDRQGRVAVESTPLPAEGSSAAWRLRPAERPVDRRNVFLYHKTTCRTVYPAVCPAGGDCDDFVLWNNRGQATETTIANLVVEKGGRLVTPPVACGLLPGTYRAHLLETGRNLRGGRDAGRLAAGRSVVCRQFGPPVAARRDRQGLAAGIISAAAVTGVSSTGGTVGGVGTFSGARVGGDASGRGNSCRAS